MSPSPEERLLALIRGKGQQLPAGTEATTSTKIPEGGSGGLGRGATSGEPALRWTTVVGGSLVVVLVIEVASLVLQVSRPLPPVSVPDIPHRQPVESAVETTPPLEVPSLSTSASRPLFQSAVDVTAPVAPPTTTKPAAGVSTKELVTRLTLMGIIAGDPAQAVIEDSETKKTYFVSTGQTVVDGAVLEQVLDNRVILDLGGEKITLSL